MSLKYEPPSEPQDVEFLVQRPAAPGINEEATLARLLDLHTALSVSLEALRGRIPASGDSGSKV